jgi:RNA 2',3'-cyclic 3'-phosphodiesterase
VAPDDRIRLFCALQLPEGVLDDLSRWSERLPVSAARRVRREDLHVTLAFLGARPAADVAAIGVELRAAAADAAAPVELRPLRYRETRGAGMIVLEDVEGRAAALTEDLQRRLEGLGVYRRERRRWLPHVTVLRFRTPEGLRPELPNMCSIHVVRSALYRSILGAGGARYDALETAALGGR